MSDFLANTNFFNRPNFIRKLQCNLFGHEWYCWAKTKDEKRGWCAWCSRFTSLYPKMRKRFDVKEIK